MSLSQEQQDTYKKFSELVNMTASELENWLDSDNSKRVGQDSGDGESIGHKSGKKIIEIIKKKKGDYTNDDFDHMHKVISYISRHTAQKPDGDVEDTNWNYSLKNWGHDYTKG